MISKVNGINKKFSVTFLLEVDEACNVLSTVQDAHEEDVHDLIRNTFHDIDDVKIDNLNIKERT
tara:strand:+ start:534 stop:725 length:192 start_codon:yes stop_codon:yes gene_type:complete